MARYIKILYYPDIFFPTMPDRLIFRVRAAILHFLRMPVQHFIFLSFRADTLKNINLAPSFRIPFNTDKVPLDYSKNESIYTADKFFPEEPVVLSKKDQVRGIDVVMLGITPFQYNPVTKQLIVYRDLKIEVSFVGGNGHFGDDRLRSRWWDPMLSDMLLNYKSLPEINYDKSFQATDETGCEYLIITPNATEFQQWADTIKRFRTTQGIDTKVVTLDEVGGNTAAILEDYINNAYYNWDIAPSACLLLGDYGTNPSNRIISPVWNGYCVSDNVYADVNNNTLPDIIFARITAQDAAQLEVMVTKFLVYERTPPVNSDFYTHPITSVGWETGSWSQLCSEVVGGFWQNVLGKVPVRINEISSGTPGSVWSTAPNTETVVNYFGPNGLGYIPAEPSELGGWSGGTAADISAAINSGAFMVQQSDHGSEDGWANPEYTMLNINTLENTDLTFVWSIDDLTGKFNYGSQVFAEKFHRYTHKDQLSGCFGINAATEVSYAFVNDVYTWGAYDYMWPDFMPDYGSTPEPRGILPAFASVAGKYFLQQSGWTTDSISKVATYHLFHHHGDAFTTVYSEVPQNLTVSHNSFLYMGDLTFDVTADVDALIALSVNGELIGTGTGTGAPVSIQIPAQAPPSQVLVTVTKQNYYRYQSYVGVLPASGPYVIYNALTLNDGSGNGNGIMETSESILAALTIENIGVDDANNVNVTITTTDPYITLTDSTENYGTVPAGSTGVITDGFEWEVAGNIPDMHNVTFEMTATDGTATWSSDFTVLGHAPALECGALQMDDYIGNGNGRLDPGETGYLIIPVYNNGSYVAMNSNSSLSCSSEFITLNNSTYNLYNIGAGLTAEALFQVTVSDDAPAGTYVEFAFAVTSGEYSHQQMYPTIVSMVVEDWESGDMSQFDWTTGGDSVWAVSNDNPYEGYYSVKSGALDNNQSNYLSIQYDVPGEDSLSFWYNVSSEAGYDFLKFYIDDIETSSWSGETGWARASYFITSGTHTFKWEYSKDESFTSGDDDALLDFIVFPVAVFEASFSSDQTDICEGDSVNFYDLSSATATSWEWTFEGGTPGTSSLQNPVIQYLTSGSYDVSLTVSDGTESNTLVLENYINVTALPETATAPSGPASVCGDTETTSYSTTGLSGITLYNWLLEPADAGSVSGTDLNATVIWTDGFLGNASLKVAGENNCGTGPYSEPLEISRYLPEVTLDLLDTICFDWPAFELTGGLPTGGVYSGPGVENGWFDPETAGLGTDTITYTYTDPNSCENFATQLILVDPCTGIDDRADFQDVRIYPNPTTGMVTIELNRNANAVEISVMNTLNKVVYTKSLKKSASTKLNIDLSNLARGLYVIKLKTEKMEKITKVILQ